MNIYIHELCNDCYENSQYNFFQINLKGNLKLSKVSVKYYFGKVYKISLKMNHWPNRELIKIYQSYLSISDK